MSIEAMKQALKALEAEHSAIYGNSMTARAITSLRQAIATEESSATQEPLVWMEISTAPKDGTRILCMTSDGFVDICQWTPMPSGDKFTSSDDRTFGGFPQYEKWMPLIAGKPPAQPEAEQAPKREPLTDEQFYAAHEKLEAAHGIKENT